jgi:tetratricopeptide (TPR) repeat protein
MAADRAEILRNAEKLLRQGKLQAAIGEYVRVVSENPRDWNSANTLGDLYLRAGQRDQAIEQFTRIADSLSHDGFLSKASALYKKILKIRPTDEHALLAAAEIAAAQGVLVDARAYLAMLIERRLARGDRDGAAQIRSRLAQLDPADLETRQGAVRAQLEAGDRSPAHQIELKAIGEALLLRGRHVEAIELLSEAAGLDPSDTEVKRRLFEACLLEGDITRAGQWASTPEQYRELAQAAMARGQDFASAAEFLGGTGDLGLLLGTAALYLRAGNTEEGLGLVRTACERQGIDLASVGAWALTLLEDAPDSALPTINSVVDAAVAKSEWFSAASLLQACLGRLPDHIPTLLRLVEVAFDGGLDEAMDRAQAQLADAYLANGAAAEARVVAENLLSRQPGEAAHLERLRKALALLGEDDSALLIDEDVGTLPDVGESAADFAAEPSVVEEPERVASEDPVNVARTANAPDDSVIEAGTGGEFDLTDAVGTLEIDLTTMLDDFRAEPAPRVEADAARSSPSVPADLDAVFEQLRDEASRLSDVEVAQREYTRGLAFLDEGRIAECIDALRAASRAPQLRFTAAAALGRLYRNRGELPQSIEWFERAVEAPAPTADEIHAVFYELAEALETGGEVARALAVCLELQADAGEYRDLPARIDRLGKVQSRG